MIDIAVLTPKDRLERIDRARLLLSIGHHVPTVEKLTGLSPFVLEILAVPEKKLRQMIDQEGRAEHDETMRRNLGNRKREAASARR
jgi:hypothetical protein